MHQNVLTLNPWIRVHRQNIKKQICLSPEDYIFWDILMNQLKLLPRNLEQWPTK